MVIPPYLRDIGYESVAAFVRVDSLSWRIQENVYEEVRPWSGLRDVFEYMACIEHGVERVDALSADSENIDSAIATKARYDCAAVVLFSQAMLDNLAVWLNGVHAFGLTNTDVSFYSKKRKMINSLVSVCGDYSNVFDVHEKFILRLNDYRMAWLHRVSGGALMFSDRSPQDPEAKQSIMVPLSPCIITSHDNGGDYLRSIERVKSENQGNWLMPASDFSRSMRDGVLSFLKSVIEVELNFRS